MMKTKAGKSEFPRFFVHQMGFATDALFVRFDSRECSAIVVTKTGQCREPLIGPWTILEAERFSREGRWIEVTEMEATTILENLRQCSPIS
jgi:hypothetical protein